MQPESLLVQLFTIHVELSMASIEKSYVFDLLLRMLFTKYCKIYGFIYYLLGSL